MERRSLQISWLLFFITIVVFLTGCTLFQDKQRIIADTPNTDLSSENIDGITLGTNIQATNFTNAHKVKKEKPESYNLDNDKYHILTNKKEEITFIEGNETIQTSKKVKVGDSIKEVIKKYGENYYEYTVQGVKTIGYIDQENECKIDFWYVNGKVTNITLSNIDVDLYL